MPEENFMFNGEPEDFENSDYEKLSELHKDLLTFIFLETKNKGTTEKPILKIVISLDRILEGNKSTTDPEIKNALDELVNMLLIKSIQNGSFYIENENVKNVVSVVKPRNIIGFPGNKDPNSSEEP